MLEHTDIETRLVWVILMSIMLHFPPSLMKIVWSFWNEKRPSRNRCNRWNSFGWWWFKRFSAGINLHKTVTRCYWSISKSVTENVTKIFVIYQTGYKNTNCRNVSNCSEFGTNGRMAQCYRIQARFWHHGRVDCYRPVNSGLVHVLGTWGYYPDASKM